MNPEDAISLGLGAINTGYNIWANRRDYDYQRELQKQIFEREDTAVQRRMADLKAAGLNPNLATGSGAGAGAVVSRSNTNDVNFGAALDTLAATEQIRSSRVQQDVGKADAKLKDAEAAEKVYETMLHMGIDATPYYNKGKFNFNVRNSGIPTSLSDNDFFHGKMANTKRSWERTEETFQSNMNLALSKINLNTSQMNQITNSINMSQLEFQQRVAEFGLKIQDQDFTHALQTYKELRAQLETKVSTQEKYATIQHMLEQEKHMNTTETQAWTKILLDTITDERKITNLLSLMYSLFY